MTDYATTGDGLIAGLQFLAEMARTGLGADRLVRQFETVPQMLKNVRYGEGKQPLADPSVQAVIAAMEVAPEQAQSYGILDVRAGTGATAPVQGIVEKPKPGTAPSNLAVIGRYILSPKVLTNLNKMKQGAGGEIQLTDGIAQLLQEKPVHAYRFQGTRFDCGTHIGLIEATIRYALDHEKLSDAARDTMQNALSELGVQDLQ